MKRILFPTDFSEAATNAFSIWKKLVNLFYYILTHRRMNNFPREFEMVYDTVELTEFEWSWSYIRDSL
jgi:hypothetical protein